MSSLSELVKVITAQKLPTLRPAHRSAGYAQQRLEGIQSASHVVLGDFFEMLTVGLFGGKLCNRMYVADDEMTNHLVKPDVVDHEEGVVRESKACRWGKSYNLFDEQIDRYIKLQTMHPDYRFSFGIFHHTFPAIKTYCGSEQELFAALAQGPIAATIMPLGLALHLHSKAQHPHVRKYYANRRKTNGQFPACTVVNPRTVSSLLLHPSETLQALGLDPLDYDINTYRAGNGLSIEGARVTSFPVRVILDRNHDRWIDHFGEHYATKPETPVLEEIIF